MSLYPSLDLHTLPPPVALPLLCTVYLSLRASGIKMCTPGVSCSTGLATLACVKQVHVLLFFTRTKQPHTLSTIYSNPCTAATFKSGSQQLLAIWGQRRGQYSRWRQGNNFSGHLYHASHVFLRMRKKLSTLNFDFSRSVNGSIGTKIKFIFHVEKS